MMSMKSHHINIFLSLNESILLRNWNQSNRITQNKVMAFSCQLVGLPILTEGQFEIFIFQCHVSIFNTGSLYSFKFKVLRVLFQLESPNSEHQNSSYVRNNSDFSMIKLMQELDYTRPHFEGIFFATYIQNLKLSISICLVLLEVYFNYPLESLKSDKK